MSGREIFINPQDRSVFNTLDLQALLPNATETASAVDQAFHDDPEGYVNSLYEVRTVKGFGTEGEDAPQFGLFYGSGSDRSRRITAMFSALGETAPLGNSEDFLDPKATKRDTHAARRAIKAANLHAALIAEGHGQPVIVFYPIKSSIFSQEDQERLARGDTRPYGKVFRQGIQQAQEELHGADSETRLEEVDIDSAMIGHVGLGAAIDTHESRSRLSVASLSLPNLIIDNNSGLSHPKRLLKVLDRAALLTRYMLPFEHSGKAKQSLSPGTQQIPETFVSDYASRNGNSIAMRRRQAESMLDFLSLQAMMTSGNIRRSIERFAEIEVPIVMPVANDSRMTKGTRQEFATSSQVEYIPIKSGVEGKGAHLITGEYDTLNYLLALLGTKRALDL